MSNTPLAEKMRPKRLEDVAGQEHLTEPGKLVYEIVNTNNPVSLILWGPPGTGKTTLARIIASESGAEFIELSAVMSGKSDIVSAIEVAKQNQRLELKTILFVDEIHRFNKSQQDAFLPHVENGTIILIGATTENPSFEVITPLLSRSKVLVLESLSLESVIKILKQTIKSQKIFPKRVPVAMLKMIADLSGGDARRALNTLDLALQLSVGSALTIDHVTNAAQTKLPSYDKDGDGHYDTISAFIKSMRGSDVTATLYYLARMINSGEDPKFIARRMIIFASEDIGLAGNGALSLAVATFEACQKTGYPECNYTLFHCATALAKSQKSRSVSDAMKQALALAEKYPDSRVPLHLRNAPTKLMKDLGYSKGTKWEANFQHPNGFMPEDIPERISV
jgi:putative ATPase